MKVIDKHGKRYSLLLDDFLVQKREFKSNKEWLDEN